MEEKNTQPQTASKKFDLHKVFAVIGVIIIVMIIIGGGIWYFVQSAEDKAGTTDDTTSTKVATSSAKTATNAAKKDPTADWQTYKNAVVGFTIKYPPKWVTETTTSNTTCEADQAFFAPEGATLGRCSSGFGGIISISRTQDSDNLTKVVANYVDADYQNLVKAKTTVGGKNAEKITGTSQINNEALNQSGYKVIVYVVDLGSRALVISYSQSPKWIDNSQNFEDMVASLTFN